MVLGGKGDIKEHMAWKGQGGIENEQRQISVAPLTEKRGNWDMAERIETKTLFFKIRFPTQHFFSK